MSATPTRTISHEHPLLMNRRLDVAMAAILVVLTAVLFALIWFDSSRATIQRIDDSFLRSMISARSGPLTAIARLLNVVGSVWVTLPVRVLTALYLAIKRRWWHGGAFVGAMVISEIAIGALKAAYDRPRPPGSLVVVTSGSFPSGHATATAVTTVALVIALFPPAGLRRWWWGAAAAVFSFVMALSRSYLAAHWLSDALAGTLLGTTIALGTALIVQAIRGAVDEPRRRAHHHLRTA